MAKPNPIAYQASKMFDAQQHEHFIKALRPEHSWERNDLQSDKFWMQRYTSTTSNTFSLLTGQNESFHVDYDHYQPLLIVNPNNWRLTGRQNSSGTCYQQAGDLIILDRGISHGVVEDNYCPKPKLKWIYLAINWNSPKFRKEKCSLDSVIYQSELAIAELKSDTCIQYLQAGANYAQKH